MNRDELIENLGTIARSGTAAFVQRAVRRRQEGYEPDRPVRRRLLFRLHGRRQGRGAEPQGRRQRGLALGLGRQGRASRSSPPPTCARGTRIIAAHARGRRRISRAAPAAADRHAPIPTISHCRSCWPTATRKRRSTPPRRLWTRPRAEITPEQYKEFYHHVGHGFDEPWLTLHARAEGVLEYTLPAVRAVAEAVRPVRSRAQVAAQALCPARLHHRRGRPSCCRPICGSCAASSTARTCRSTSAARCCSRTRWWRASASS